jgi:hypothetical protein
MFVVNNDECILGDVPASGDSNSTSMSKSQPASLSSMLQRTVMKRKSATGEPQDVHSRVDDELKSYLNAAAYNGGVPLDADPLQWWSKHCSSFPVAAELAKKYLCVHASSVSSERLFSIAGNIVSKRRSSMKPDTVNKMVFLACNL